MQGIETMQTMQTIQTVQGIETMQIMQIMQVMQEGTNGDRCRALTVLRSAGPEGEGGCFDSPSLPPLDSLPSRSDQGGALDPKAEGRSGRLAEKALYCASEVLRIAFSGRHPPCAPIGMRARFGGRACTRPAQPIHPPTERRLHDHKRLL